LRHYIDFAWKADGGPPLPALELDSWESIIREVMGDSGWVVMRQVHGIWHVEEAELTRFDGETDELKQHTDRRDAVKQALLLSGKTIR
jgi:hypothetical protein